MDARDITRASLAGSRQCIKKPKRYRAIQLSEHVILRLPNGKESVGKPGDYLVENFRKQRFIVSSEIFHAIFSFIER